MERLVEGPDADASPSSLAGRDIPGWSACLPAENFPLHLARRATEYPRGANAEVCRIRRGIPRSFADVSALPDRMCCLLLLLLILLLLDYLLARPSPDEAVSALKPGEPVGNSRYIGVEVAGLGCQSPHNIASLIANQESRRPPRQLE